MKNEHCSARVHDPHSFRGRSCSKPGKDQVDGKWYCSSHSPEKVAARRKKLEEKWDMESKVAAHKMKIGKAESAVVLAALFWYDKGHDTGAQGLREAILDLRVLKAAKP